MLDELRSFIAVVEEKNFTKAAEKVSLSQPSVSVHIKNLETYFNTELVMRSIKPKKIMITDSGKLLYRRSKELLSLFETMKDELKDISNTIKGHLRIGATLTIGECLLPQFLAEFCKHYPDIDVEIFIGNTMEVTSMTKALRLDVALMEGALHTNYFKQNYFLEDQLVLIFPQDHPLVTQPFSYNLLQNQRWLTREQGSSLRESLDSFLAVHSIIPKNKVAFSSNYAIKEAVKNHLGIAMVSNYMVKDLSPKDNIFVLKINDEYKRGFSYILPKDLRISRVTEIFIDALLLYCQDLTRF